MMILTSMTTPFYKQIRCARATQDIEKRVGLTLLFLLSRSNPLIRRAKIEFKCTEVWASRAAIVVKNLPAHTRNIRDMGSIPGSGRFPGGGHGTLLQSSCLENPVDRGAWRATVHRVIKLDMTEAS